VFFIHTIAFVLLRDWRFGIQALLGALFGFVFGFCFGRIMLSLYGSEQSSLVMSQITSLSLVICSSPVFLLHYCCLYCSQVLPTSSLHSKQSSTLEVIFLNVMNLMNGLNVDDELFGIEYFRQIQPTLSLKQPGSVVGDVLSASSLPQHLCTTL